MRVATMESQDVDAIDAICKRVQLAAAQGSVGVLGLGICVNLMRLRRRLDNMERIVAAREVRTEGDRRLLREVAQVHQRFANTMSRDRDQVAGMQPSPFFKFAIIRLFDALVVKAEDVAETAALGASVEFADLVNEDLKGHSAIKADG